VLRQLHKGSDQDSDSLLTLINDGDSVSVVDQSRQCAQIVLLGQLFVCNLDEADSQRVGLVVDVLEFLQCFIRFSALWLICNSIQQVKNIVFWDLGRLLAAHVCCK
jgi:hypothetical protein